MQERQPLTRVQLFDLYVRMRRGGLSMEEVVTRLEGDAFQLPKPERHQLNNDVVEWEDHQAQQRQQANTPPPAVPQRPDRNAPPQGIQPIQQLRPIAPIQPPPQTPANGQPRPNVTPSAFATKFLDASKVDAYINAQAAQSAPPVMCPKCGKKNAASALHCITCGAVLKSLEIRTKHIDAPPEELNTELKDVPHVYLLVRGYKQPLEVYLREEMMLGRVVAGAALQPQVDLTAYDGENQGVSRIHASLKIEQNTVVLTDLKSSNRTYVNGQRLYPHEARVLRHGDEIRLGKLVMKLQFKL